MLALSPPPLDGSRDSSDVIDMCGDSPHPQVETVVSDLISRAAEVELDNTRAEVHKSVRDVLDSFDNIKGEGGSRVVVQAAKDYTTKRVDHRALLARMVCRVLNLLESHDGDLVLAANEMLDDPIFAEFKFKLALAAPENAIREASYGTTGDGYCLFRATEQNEFRESELKMSMNAVVQHGRNLTPAKLSEQIHKYRKSIHCDDKNAELLVHMKLEGVAWNALHMPGEVNPMNNWGNSSWCRFLPTRHMIFDYSTGANYEAFMHKEKKHIWGFLAVVSYPVVQRQFPKGGLPLFFAKEIPSMLAMSNNLAFRNSHFFVIENKCDKDPLLAHDALFDWLCLFFDAAMKLTDRNKTEIIEFATKMPLLMPANPAAAGRRRKVWDLTEGDDSFVSDPPMSQQMDPDTNIIIDSEENLSKYSQEDIFETVSHVISSVNHALFQ